MTRSYFPISAASRFVVGLALIALAGSGCSEFVLKNPDAVTVAPDTGPDTGPTDSPCKGVVCDDGNECTVDSCDASECVFSGKPAGTACDDGLFCTVGETCGTAGCGGGTVRQCPDSNGGCRVGTCDETAGACAQQSAGEGAGCDDGDACTTGEQCSPGGQCLVGAPVQCADPAESCLTFVCESELGGCIDKPLADNAVCSDGDPCTQDDACSAGVCSGAPRDCTDFDGNCLVGVCEAESGECASQTAEDTVVCDDGAPCTSGDTCTDGACAGTAVDCSGMDALCVQGICNDATGQCAGKNLDSGEACEDGDPCTADDGCALVEDGEAVACVGGPGPDCSNLEDECTVGVCDPAIGGCVGQAANDNQSCDDGDACTLLDACVLGVCVGQQIDCEAAAEPCQQGSCLAGQCVFSADPLQDTATCDDGQFCSVDTTCLEGVCTGSPRDCTDVDATCLLGICDEALDACQAQPVEDLEPCDDGQFCTLQDACLNGLCAGQQVLDCTSLDNVCNEGFCSEAAGGCMAVAVAGGDPCDDGTLCTDGDACSDGVCAGIPVDCSGANTDCLVGECDPSDGSCVSLAVPDGASCSDLVDCTQGDECLGGGCQSGVPVGCPCSGPSRALDLKGGCVTVPGAVFLESALGFTVEFWVKTLSQTSGVLLDQRLTASVGENDWHIRYELAGPGGQLRFLYGNVTNADSQIGMSGVTLNDGEWHHVAVTRDETTMRWWVDGKGLNANITTNIQALDNGAPLTLGCGAFGGEPFMGTVDELRISNFARYVSDFTPPGRHLRDSATVGLWHLDEPSGSATVADISGNDHSGTVSGTASATQLVAPVMATCCGDGVLDIGEECDDGDIATGDDCDAVCLLEGGPPQSALSLDGLDDCLQVNTSLLPTVSNMTLGLWIATTQSGVARILDKRVSAAPQSAGWSIVLVDGVPRFEVSTDTQTVAFHAMSALPINDGLWHHIAVTFTAVKVVRWYLDGQPQPATQLTEALAPGNQAPLRIGCGLDGEHLDAIIDAVHIRTKVAYSTAPFVPVLAPAPENSSALLLGFDQPLLGAQTNDLSSGGNHAVVSGGPQLVEPPLLQ
ncbi:MAG: hypothetical protein ACI9WU_002070 [Myxococcota bacterium]|jgi:hypothetical protein